MYRMSNQISETISRSVWYGWGDPAKAKPLNQTSLDYLQTELGLDSIAVTRAPVPFEQVVLPESSLSAAQITALRGVLSPEQVSTNRKDRIVHSGGKSTPDLLRRRSGDCRNAPDAVLFPHSSEEVAALLTVCAEQKIAVVPFGGGTSVVGGVDPNRGKFSAIVSIDLEHLDSLLRLDPVSRTATFQAGIRGPAVEAALAPLGFTLGHLPQSHQEATLGGYAATRSAGQASTGYGRSDELITAVRVETPRGPLHLGGRAPASAAGPKLLDVVIGSEGTLGIITEVTVRIVPAPKHKSYGAWAFPDFESGSAALRALIQDGAHSDMPDVCRLSDQDETYATFRQSGSREVALLENYLKRRGYARPALALFLWEGQNRATAARKRRSAAILRKAGGIYVTGLPAKAWEKGRFSAPYLRDELLGRGVLVETLETAAEWSNLDTLHAEVSQAIANNLQADHAGGGYVMCHVSHVYPDGASLYYTFVTGMEGDGLAPSLAQCQRIKKAASEAIVAAGATITHHHAVGQDHAPYLKAEIGELGVEVLAGIKEVLDPEGILNPGKLISQG